jgi:hypothetical protein
MRLPTLQTLTWGTIAASIVSALLLADDGDQGLPLLTPLAEHSSHPHADDRQARPANHATTGRRSNGHANGHSRDERNVRRGPR